MTTLNITIGPVQGFVVQARRTRDLWSGSFLLSYLTGHAMVGAEKAGGRIEEPDISKDMIIDLIKNRERSKVDPLNLIGSLPNRFKVECEDPEDVAHKARNAFDEAWNKISEAVWNQYLDGMTNGNDTRAIWDRQLKDFWEFTWTIGDQKGLEARKNWRKQDLAEEGGDHCTLMGDRQELSGYVRFKQKKKQDVFWKSIAEKTGELDLQADERLCAIAFIKRFFPKVAKEAIGKDLGTIHWPSTVYMAAVPWLRSLGDKEKEKLDLHYENVKLCGRSVLRPDIPKMLGLEKLGRYAQLDGNFYYKDLIKNKNATPLKKDCKEKRTGLIRSIGEVGSSPKPYYALLLMDGDNLGAMKKENPEDKVKEISHALSSFSREVPHIVRMHNGVTIYAGGDDVLAMLPMDTAIGCAVKLKDHYRTAFKDMDLVDNTKKTISAGLVYTHYHQPLQSVYHEAHHILDDVAKDENGRDSIAVTVLKSSGKYLQWVSKWDEMTEFEKAQKAYSDKKTFSSSLMYSIRESLSLLTDLHNWKPGSEMDIGSIGRGDYQDLELDLEALIVADMMRSREGKIKKEEAEQKLKPILNICYRDDRKKFLVDGWFLVRFLASEGVEQ